MNRVENRRQQKLVKKLDRAKQHFNAGRLLQAKRIYQQIRKSIPNHPVALHMLGFIAHKMGEYDIVVDLISQAVAIAPDYIDAHNNLGNALGELGRMDEAAASFRKALALDPNFAEAHRNLAGIKKHSEHDEDIWAMEQAYAKPNTTDEQRMHLAFGLGKAFEDLRLYEKAFGFFAEGNSIKRESYSFSIDDQDNFFKKLEEAFDASLFAKHQGTGCDDETPIFILGMMRSGTTLVEQILASHRQVYGAGELETMNKFFSSYFDKGNGVELPATIRQADRADFKRIGVEYIQAIRKLSSDNLFVTDKMPGNFRYIGLIKLMLPNAKVINCRRDPADNCLSIFKNYFTGNHEYAYDLREIGRYYNLYHGLMDHWQSVISGFIHNIQYEDLVADPIGQIRTLLEYCGLDWDDACLDFHKTDRPVRTASGEQVRKPIYKDSVQLWKRYKTQLAPMIEILR